MPWFAKELYAATISYTLKSAVPNAMEGTFGIFELIPKSAASLLTGPGPTLSINLALMVFTEFASAFFRVRIPVYLSPEFFGHQAS